jgi:diamine N-acetyltransferase
MDIRIRDAEVRDYTQVNGIAAEYQAEHADALPDVFALTKNVLGRPWFNSFIGSADKAVRVAETPEGEIAAFAMIETKRSMPYAAFVPRKDAVIYELGVASQFRRQGVGSRLLADCREWAKARGADSLELTVFEFNRRAIDFYESAGMETLSRTMRIGLDG